MVGEGWRGGRKVRPTLVVGVGEWGAQVAAAFTRRVDERAGRLPVVRAVALAAEGDAETRFFPKNLVSTGLIAELERIRHLDAVQAARRARWGVESKAGSGVILVASLGNGGTGKIVSRLARWLRALSERDFACRLALSGVLLLPRDASQAPEDGAPGEDTDGRQDDSADVPDDSVQAGGPQPGQQVPSPAGAMPCEHGGSASCASAGPHPSVTADDLALFDEGCYLLDQVNADGLLVARGQAQAELVARWLALRVLTPLQAALERVPIDGASASFDTFGLAMWEFPLQPLTAHLARRWQREALKRLLASPADDHGQAVARAFVEQHGQDHSPWPQEASLRFQVAGDAWARPALNLVRELREQIDSAVAAEHARLNTLIARGEELFDAVCREIQDGLTVEVDALLDDAGLGATGGFLAALEATAHRRATRLAEEAERRYAQVEELDEPADEAGRALEEAVARFPPCRLRTLVGLALRPWRLVHLWLLYREIGQRAGVYLAYRQSQWLLQAETRERQWQAALCSRMAGMAAEENEAIARLRARLERLRQSLASDAGDPDFEQTLARRLEAAALPSGLADHFYRRAVGDEGATPAGFVAVYGPLSRWAREGCEAEALGMSLAEHAREQFAFLAEVHLDGLLARTHSGAALRCHLGALVDAATPWWACDETALDAEERALLRRLVLIGLPDAGNSLLVDLIPDRPPVRPVSCFSTGDPHQVIAIQVTQGLSPTCLTRCQAPDSERANQPPSLLQGAAGGGPPNPPPCFTERLGEGH